MVVVAVAARGPKHARDSHSLLLFMPLLIVTFYAFALHLLLLACLAGLDLWRA
jgi:hypothetical protein